MQSILKYLMIVSCFMFIPAYNSSIVSQNNRSITIKGELEHEGYLYSYGFIRNLDTNETDGVLMKTNIESNQLVFEIYYDIGYDEVFLYLALVSEHEVAVVCKNTFTYNSYEINEFISTDVLIYDMDGFLITKKTIEKMPKAYGNINYRLFLQCEDEPYFLNHLLEEKSWLIDEEELTSLDLQFQGKAYIDKQEKDEINLTEPGVYFIEIYDTLFALRKEITIYPKIIGVEDQQTYTHGVDIESNGEVYINSEKVNSPINISEPGNYILGVFGANDFYYELFFQIDFTYSGIEEGQQSKECITISSNALQMMIDEQNYQGNLYCYVGNHVLQLFGVSNYKKEITFSILPKVDGVSNYEQFTEPITIFVRGEAYLNGERMSEETRINQTGNYFIEVMFDGVIYEQIFFTIRLPNEEETVIEKDKNYVYEIALGILLILGFYMIFKKK